MSDEGSGAVTSERRFRMTLDFRVLIGDVREEDIKKRQFDIRKENSKER